MNTILNYLRQLENNNNKPWFDAHKNEYLEARAHFNAIVERLIEGICSFDSSIKGIGIKESTYRIIRTCASPKTASRTRLTSALSSRGEARNPDIADTIFTSAPVREKTIHARAFWQSATTIWNQRC